MIQTTIKEYITYITIDRSHRRNALTPDGLDKLRSAVETTDTPVVCLRGAGTAFCAGADLDIIADLNCETGAAFAKQGQRVVTAIEESAAVVVAAIDGAARGGGVELALACDIRIATPAATFAETGVRLGLFGAWGGTSRLPRVVGKGNAMDLALSGRAVDAEEALRMGLVSQIVEQPDEVAMSLAENDPTALRVIKDLLHNDGSPEQQDHREMEAFARLVDRVDLTEDRIGS